MKLIPATMRQTMPDTIIIGPDGRQWEVWPGGWISSPSGDWQLVKDPNTRVLWCVYEESDALAAIAAHFTIESMEITTDGP